MALPVESGPIILPVTLPVTLPEKFPVDSVFVLALNVRELLS